MRGRTLVVAFVASVLAAPGHTETKATTFTRGSGGSIQTKLGGNFVVNKNSSLAREWLTLHDPAMLVDIKDNVGITTVYVGERIGSHYEYSTSLRVVPTVDLAAIELRFLVFDLWGDHVKTLLMDEVEDMKAGEDHPLTGAWRAWTENEISRHYASIAYVSRVRTKDGRVVGADPTPVIEEARKFSKKFTAADLEPKAEQPPGLR